MQISARFVNNWHYFVKHLHTLHTIKEFPVGCVKSTLSGALGTNIEGFSLGGGGQFLRLKLKAGKA